MSRDELEAAFHQRVLRIYQDAGTELGYWAHRFRQRVERAGGLTAAKDWLKPESGITAGFRRLLEHDRLDLSLEAAVLESEWEELFTPEELATARVRLTEYGYFELTGPPVPTDQLVGDELSDPDMYPEGARKRIVVNSYERNPEARKACIEEYGSACFVCRFDFASVYWSLGEGFIHVHHLNPLALRAEGGVTRPSEDLRPVCPNCHAMLHKQNPPIPIRKLRELIQEQRTRIKGASPQKSAS